MGLVGSVGPQRSWVVGAVHRSCGLYVGDCAASLRCVGDAAVPVALFTGFLSLEIRVGRGSPPSARAFGIGSVVATDGGSAHRDVAPGADETSTAARVGSSGCSAASALTRAASASVSGSG